MAVLLIPVPLNKDNNGRVEIAVYNKGDKPKALKHF